MRKCELDQLTDKKFLDPVVVENTYGEAVMDEAIYKKAKIYNTQIAHDSISELGNKDKDIYDRDAASFKIVPEVSEILAGDCVCFHALANGSEDDLAPNDPNVVWESNDFDVAYFTPDGFLHAQKVGEVIITATDVENPDVEPVSRTINVVSELSEEPAEDDDVDPTPEP